MSNREQEFKPEDLKPSFNFDSSQIYGNLFYLENGMTITGLKPKKISNTSQGKLRIKYPLQLQQVRTQEGSRLLFVPIVGCSELFDIRHQGVTGSSPLAENLRAAYAYAAHVQFGLTDEAMQARVDAAKAEMESGVDSQLAKIQAEVEQHTKTQEAPTEDDMAPAGSDAAEPAAKEDPASE